MPQREDDTDDLVRQVLEEAEEASNGGEAQSAPELLTQVFRGRNRRLAIGGALVNSVLFVACVWSGVRYLRADDARETALWGIAMLLGFGLLIAIKIWYWLEMNRLALARDIKRVELRVARIADVLDDDRYTAGERSPDDPDRLGEP